VNPVATAINSVDRSWNDANGNRIPDCDLANRTANGECGAMANQNFGGTRPTTQYADNVLTGLGNRGNNWDLSTEVQHQLTGAVSVSAGYFRNWNGNFQATDNTLVGPADYNTYCITAPMDSRLPGGGGYQVCGLADITPAKFGQVNSIVKKASDFGKQTRINDFFNVTLNTRLGQGIVFGGGVDTGRTVTDNCFTVDSPQQLLNCHVVTPLKGNTQVKAFGSYPLPGDFVVSAIFQNIAGPEITAAYAVPTSAIAPSLGRNLASCGVNPACTSTAAAPLIKPGTMFADRMTRLDLRLGKRFRLSDRISVQGNLNVFNVFNGVAVLALNNNYGGAWQRPSRTQDGRMIQFSGTLNY